MSNRASLFSAICLACFIFLPATAYAKSDDSKEDTEVIDLSSQLVNCDEASIGGPCTPPMPVYTSVTLSGQTVTLQWSVYGNYDYIHFGQSTNGAWGNDETLFVNSLSRLLVAGNTYVFRVAACSYMHGCSDYSISQSVVVSGGGGGTPGAFYLHPPANLTATFSGSTLTATWAAVTGVASYRIRQNVNGNWQTEINKGSTRTHNFTISANNIYSYQVRGCNASAQCSEWSNTITINTSPVVTYIHTDILGSVIGESNQSGVMLKKTEYKPFGERKEQ